MIVATSSDEEPFENNVEMMGYQPLPSNSEDTHGSTAVQDDEDEDEQSPHPAAVRDDFNKVCSCVL